MSLFSLLDNVHYTINSVRYTCCSRWVQAGEADGVRLLPFSKALNLIFCHESSRDNKFRSRSKIRRRSNVCIVAIYTGTILSSVITFSILPAALVRWGWWQRSHSSPNSNATHIQMLDITLLLNGIQTFNNNAVPSAWLLSSITFFM